MGRAWAPEETLLRYAALAVVRPPTIEAPAHIYPPTVSTRVPRLVAERDTGDAVELVNTGNADAYGITVEPLPGMGDAWVPVGEIPPGRISLVLAGGQGSSPLPWRVSVRTSCG